MNHHNVALASPFAWDAKRNHAAQLLAEGKLSDEQIATTLGRSRRWLAQMKRRPEFQERVDTIVTDTAAALKSEGIANLQARIDDSIDLHNRMPLAGLSCSSRRMKAGGCDDL